MPESWPHAPAHRLSPDGAFIVTGATLHKQKFFDTPGRKDIVLNAIFDHANKARLELQAWAVLANHYHLVIGPESAASSFSLRMWITRLHADIGRELNADANAPGRKVMYQYWDTRLTFEKSWLARLHYVHHNPVHHGLVKTAMEYPWCSARWFEVRASESFRRSVCSFKLDRVQVPDDF